MKIIQIVEKRKLHFVIPAAVLALALIFMVINGAMGNGMFNYDVDFAGGTSMHIDFKEDVKNDDVARIISDTTGEIARIQKVTGTTQLVIKMKSIDSEQRVALIAALKDAYSKIDEQGIETTDVSATVSGEMQRTALIAVLAALAAMFVYIAIRFRDVRIGGSTIINLLINALAVISFYAILRVPLSDSFIIVILTILGYSVNNTIVVFDRVRENRKLLTRPTNAELINVSVSQTMRRSLYTSLTTLFTIVCLYILGVQSIREFALPIILGVLFGTYTSVCFAGSVWYTFIDKSKTKAA